MTEIPDMKAVCDLCGEDFGEMGDSATELALHIAKVHDKRPSDSSVKRRNR